MKIKHKLLAAVLVLATSGSALAETYSLWINGMSSNNKNKEGLYNNFSYWGEDPVGNDSGVNPKAVNWDGSSRISTSNRHIRDALDKYCTGSNSCHIAAHSAGNLQIGYALSEYGQSARPKPGGGTQKGWNILSVRVAGGAAGGSEVAGAYKNIRNVVDTIVDSATGYDLPVAEVIKFLVDTQSKLLEDLIPATARSLYDHNVTNGVIFRMYAGSKYMFTRPVFTTSENDGLVAYHSAGGVSGSSGRPLCNKRLLGCGELTTESDANKDSLFGLIKGGEKWNNHTVSYRDDAGQKPHGSGNGEKHWGGIIGVVRNAMAARAY